MEDREPRVAEFDIRGQVCPSTLIIALREMNNRRTEIKSGEIRLVFKTDNRDATITVPEAAMTMGYAASVTKVGDCYTIVIGDESEGGR